MSVMKVISFEKRKTAIQRLLIILMILCQSPKTLCQLNLQDSYPMTNGNVLQFDCLHYYVQNSTVIYQESADVVNELIPYCIRLSDEMNASFGDFIATHGILLSFEELRHTDITAWHLLSWSISVDLAERYQLYLNELNASLNKHFYNCTPPWFGALCQYSFPSSKNTNIAQIVEEQFRRRSAYSEASDMVAQLPCYIQLQCNRGGIYLCLDWREVCDGHVDCLDGAEDEIGCYELESNECADDEFRCHNGLCIPQEFWKDGFGDTECLDRSDQLPDASIKSCFQDPRFRCEEHSCRRNFHEFACGDGECVDKFQDCNNGRHSSLKEAMSAKGTLPEKCWIAMVCLTELASQINETSCKTLRMNNSILDYLNECESLFQFPVIPIHFDHIRFLYESPQLKWNISFDFIPDYVCYDEQLCSFLISNFSYENYSCLHSNDIGDRMDYDVVSWDSIIFWIDEFFQGCSNTHQIMNNKNKSSLYFCQNSSKSIPKDRIFDQNEDCYLGDDENPLLSCSMNNKYRVRCPGREQCLSPLLNMKDCLGASKYNEEQIPFEEICDGIPRIPDAHRKDSPNELDCWNWPCDNMYSRCDNRWTCRDGRDELNCGQKWCPAETFACISPTNHTVFCLPAERVNDSIVDCHWASDELELCLTLYPRSKDARFFHCLDDDRCLPLSKICNGVADCLPSGDDEKICPERRPLLCHETSISNRSVIEDLLCRLRENSHPRYFSVHTSVNYPPLESKEHDKLDHWAQESHAMTDNTQSWNSSYPWPWVCNRGLLVHVPFGNNSIENRCLCPPSYYGNWCQYQNQRVSVTLKVVASNRSASYALILMLIDDNDEEQQIESYDQTVYISKHSCSLKLNRYLLYSKRPKNTSKNYSVRLHAFEKNQMTYVASWHFSITFLFLPVNRLAALVTIPTTPASIVSDCVKRCQKGQCVRYLNKKTSFCQCSSGWSGMDCHIPLNCASCSKDSICLGTTNNRSICVCPLTQFGPQCLLTSRCPSNTCLNGGHCIPADVTVAGSEYYCICPEKYFGSRCEMRRGKLNVALDIIHIPSYVIAYFISTSNKSKPINTIVLQRLTLLQRTVTFHISIPYNLVVIKTDEIFYLAVVQKSSRKEISTSINPSRACVHITSLFNATLMDMVRYRRVKYYHQPCQENRHLHCFLDEAYLCLCTHERHVNCMDFDHQQNLKCLENDWCRNGVECLQDHPSCPSTKICVCQDCFFGNRCQFYAKGFGLTLDEILGYEIQRNVRMIKQPLSVQLSAVVTMIMFVIGFVNSILAIFVFSEKQAKEVGCGIYLLTSSVTSLIIVIAFTLKFWILFFSHMDSSIRRYLVIASGFGIEILLKISLYTDNWLNAFVAIERAYTVYKGVSFDKRVSRIKAKRAVWLLPLCISLLLAPQFWHLSVFDDKNEDRTWCVMRYSSWLQIYNLTTISFHFVAPLLINQLSAIFVIISTARQRAGLETDKNCWKHFYAKLKQYKHLLISPLMLSILSLLHVSITLSMDCSRSSRRFWFHLAGYFLSFTSSVFFFIIFVLPSKTYRKGFKDAYTRLQRRFFPSRQSFTNKRRR